MVHFEDTIGIPGKWTGRLSRTLKIEDFFKNLFLFMENISKWEKWGGGITDL